MSRGKQIEEIYKIIEADCETACHECKYKDKDGRDGKVCIPLLAAERLYNAGYRKQSEGEWELIEQEDFIYKLCKCSVCGAETFFEADDELCSYCPNCGAKMKGGGE